MEPVSSHLSGFFMAFFLLQITVSTQAMSLNIQINIPEGILVECTSGGLIPPAEMTWRDSKGNIIPHSSKFDSQDSTGLLYLKSSILLKNRTHGPVTCSIYNATTNQEKKKSIVLPDVLFKPEYMSLMSKRLSCPVMYLSIILVLHILKGICVFCCLLWKKYKITEGEAASSLPPEEAGSSCSSAPLCVSCVSGMVGSCQSLTNGRDSKIMRLCCEFVYECLLLVLYIIFLPLYLQFRNRASILDDAYPLYSSWLWDVCVILVVMMVFFTVLILLLLCTLNTRQQKSQCCSELEDEILTLSPLHHLPHDST